VRYGEQEAIDVGEKADRTAYDTLISDHLDNNTLHICSNINKWSRDRESAT